VTMIYDQTVKNESERSRWWTPNRKCLAYISDSSLDSNGISSAIPILSGSSCSTEHVAVTCERILRNRKRKVHGGGLLTLTTFIFCYIRLSWSMPVKFHSSMVQSQPTWMFHFRFGRMSLSLYSCLIAGSQYLGTHVGTVLLFCFKL